ncbi:MAG: pyridoxal phosphate-dependent aminotransferase [Rhodobacteraceae bacterium]|nr:MAG: pyridoxal phosphate-dependent aminotransferase [Paracoccaceae bacterium]
MDAAAPPFTPLVAGLPARVPFVGPEAQERARGAPFRARLGANESLFGPSPAAIAAMRAAAAEAWAYGDPEAHALRSAIAAHAGAPLDGVVAGEGIDGLLGVAARLFLEPGAVAVTSAGAYPTFVYHAAGCGARVATAPYRDDREDWAALAALARETDARVVYLANPDNPMGGWITGAEVAAFLDALPPRCIAFLDEAYGEFAPAEAHAAVDPDDPRAIRFRTFSKAHGLAGLRVGYALAAPEIARAFDRLRNHFGLGRVAQAGALAALADGAWLTEVVARTAAARGRIAAIGAASGLAALPSATNFVALDCGAGARARAILDGLLARGVFVRMPGVAPLDRCIRVTAGDAAALDVFAEALPEAVAAASTAG